MDQPGNSPEHEGSLQGAQPAAEELAQRFEQNEPGRFDKLKVAAGAGIAATGAAVALSTGAGQELLDAQYIPDMPFYEGIVNGMVDVNEGLRDLAPFAAAGAVATGVYHKIMGNRSDREASLNRLARTEYSGVNDIATRKQDSGERFSRFANWARRATRGRAVATLLVLIAASTSGIENKVTQGPIDGPIDGAIGFIAPGGDDDGHMLMLQSQNNTFMDDSDIDKNRIDQIEPEEGQAVVPFDKKLHNIDDLSSLQVSVPDETYEARTGTEVEEGCSEPTALFDKTIDSERPDINGVEVENIGTLDDIAGENVAQMNRSVAILPDSYLADCVQGGTDYSYFGAVLSGFSEEEARQLLQENGLADDAAVVSEAQFKENNRDFWRFNATPVLLQLIAYSAILGGFAVAGNRRNALEKNIREVSNMHADGIQMRDIRSVERRKALRDTAIATALAAPAIPAASALLNAAERGLYTGVGLRELMVGSTVVLLAKLIGGRRAVKSFEKDLDVAQAVKG